MIAAALPKMAEAFWGVPGLTPGSVAIVAVLLPILGTVLVALIRGWPALRKTAIEARSAVRAERRGELDVLLEDKNTSLDDCRERLDAFEARLKAAEDRFHSAELQVVAIVSAYSIVDGELERERPNSITLAQARRMMRAAFPTAADLPPYLRELLQALMMPAPTVTAK